MPVPGPGDALVEVRAAALTAGERAWPRHWPAIPGHEVSGVISELGDGTTGVHVGEEVFGLINFDLDGAAADYVAVPAADLAAKPASLDHVSAASMTLAPLTAWQALVDHGHVQPGQQVLINGAAGGVGGYAVQLASALGATVTATAKTTDADYVRSLGADVVIDNAARDGTTLDGTIDVVVDLIGEPPWHNLREGGLMIGIASEPSADEAKRHRVRSTFFIVEPDGPELAHLAKLAEGRPANHHGKPGLQPRSGRRGVRSPRPPPRPRQASPLHPLTQQGPSESQRGVVSAGWSARPRLLCWSRPTSSSPS